MSPVLGHPLLVGVLLARSRLDRILELVFFSFFSSVFVALFWRAVPDTDKYTGQHFALVSSKSVRYDGVVFVLSSLVFFYRTSNRLKIRYRQLLRKKWVDMASQSHCTYLSHRIALTCFFPVPFLS